MDRRRPWQMLSIKQALEACLPFEDPGERACPHCGRALDPLGIELNSRVIWVSSAECDCEGAQLERARALEESIRIEAERLSGEKARRYEKVGIPRRFRDADIDDGRLIGYIASFSEAKGGGLYIHGKVGRGKTYSASALAREFSDAGYAVVFTTAKDMLESVKSTFDGVGTTAATIRRYTECDILAIDDLGKEDATEWSVGTIFSIVNARYEAMLPTIMTSNYAPSELAQRLARKGERITAEAIVSRIVEMSRIVHLSGPDRRAARSACATSGTLQNPGGRLPHAPAGQSAYKGEKPRDQRSG